MVVLNVHFFKRSIFNEQALFIQILLCGSALISMRIRIQGFDEQNLQNFIQQLKFSIKNCKSQASTKDVQAFSPPQKRITRTSKHEILALFYFCGSFLPSWIRIQIQPTKINSNPQHGSDLCLTLFYEDTIGRSLRHLRYDTNSVSYK